MRSLDQIRAANAFKAASRNNFEGKDGGEVVKKIPAYIRVNGFLSTLAFALEKNGSGYPQVFDAIAGHLSSAEIKLVNAGTSQSLLAELSECDSAKLRAVTAEAMEYLNYLRRFASHQEGGQQNE